MEEKGVVVACAKLTAACLDVLNSQKSPSTNICNLSVPEINQTYPAREKYEIKTDHIHNRKIILKKREKEKYT